jgi:folate-binding protein YgfZ
MIPAPDLEGRWRLLADRAVFRVSGADRLRYLNGQVTNDVARASGSMAIPACLCTIKGKVEALVWIRADGDSFLIDGEAVQREALHARLERYLIADDCEIEDISEQVRFHHHFLGESGGGVSSRRLRIPGRDLILSREDPAPFPPGSEISESEWALEEILSALPKAGLEIRADEFPAELGLDATAVDFHKGCYLGQEIISRIRSVGRVKRILKVIEADRPLAAGDPVTASSGEKGIVTRASETAENGKQFSLALFSMPSADSALSNPDGLAIV